MLPYGVQLEAKRALVEEALARIGKLGPVAVDPVEGMEDPWRYRNKAQLPVQVEGRGVAVGYYAQRSHRVIDLRTCLVHHESLDRALETVRGALGREELPELKHILVRTGFATGETLLVLVTWSRRPLLKLAARIWEKQAELVGIAQNCNPARTNVVLGRETFPLRGKTAFRERLKDRTLQVSATSFFQINPPQAERLYALALELADPQRSDTFVDAYCGVGGMSFYLAERAGAVIGIEEIYSSIQDAIQNARRNGVDRCRFVQSRVEEVLPQLERVDGLVIDPPRSGCSPSVLGEILRISPRRVVYISCDPATLARDLAVLVEGGYRINRVVPIDFFPQTYHIEVVVSLAR
jgi:23S rRNA (uracil1939-C5)-methyltransferase